MGLYDLWHMPVLMRRPPDTVDQILNRTFDAGQFDELETVWMLSACVYSCLFFCDLTVTCYSHSVAAANDVDPTRNGLPFDSTPTQFDGQFFVETQLVGTGFPGYAFARFLSHPSAYSHRTR